MLVAIENNPTVFDTNFLIKFSEFSDRCKELPHVTMVSSLSNFQYPVKTPFGFGAIPALHIHSDTLLVQDRERILNDERFVYNLINEDGTALVVFIKTTDQLSIAHSYELMDGMHGLLDEYKFQDTHLLGRAFFQAELADMQKREVVVSTILGAFLVGIILILLFRRFVAVLIAISSIGLGLVLFFGLMVLLGREMNAIAAFYPVLMLIVGTSDVVHIMTKYLDELRKGKSNNDAITVTIKEIGLATLMTSITTAVGFLSLTTSRLLPIQAFGINSAMGVVLAFICVILFTCSILSIVPKEKILREKKSNRRWENGLDRVNLFTQKRANGILMFLMLFLVVSGYGISTISTNYDVKSNLPKNSKITDDFEFFEKEMAGFRPLEFAVSLKDGKTLDDFEVIQNISTLEQHLRTVPTIKSVSSIADVYKSINQMFNSNRQEAYLVPKDEKTFDRYKGMVKRMPKQMTSTLISKDGTKTRISTRIKDLGADNVKDVGVQIDNYVQENIDTTLMSVRRTGTGLIFDKNAVYVRENLLHGLGIGLLVIGLLMGFLFKSFRMLFISLVPNVLPLIFAAALIGYAGIKLEAVISIVFALIFGIAVDDSIHFLSKYKLAFDKFQDKEKALEVTFRETGKAICFTTIILFFGFMIMLFSIHPPSVVIGLLISVTLMSALVADLYLLPVLIRKFL